MKTKLLVSFLIFVSICGFPGVAKGDEPLKEIHLVIEGSGTGEPTFIVMEYKEGQGIRYLECEKPAGEVKHLVQSQQLDLKTLRCSELNKTPLSADEVREIRKKANDGSLFERYLGKEKKYGCAALGGPIGGLLTALISSTLFERFSPRERCIFVLDKLGVHPVSAGRSRPSWAESARTGLRNTKDIVLEHPRVSRGAASVALLGAAFCAHGLVMGPVRAEKRQDSRWIFAHDPELGADGSLAKPIDAYQAKRMTIAQIKTFIREQ